MFSVRRGWMMGAFGLVAMGSLAGSALAGRQASPLSPAPFEARGLPEPRHRLLPGGLPMPFEPKTATGGTTSPMPADYPVAPPAKWTYLVYIAGDNDLEDYVVSDIETELASPGSTNDVQVVAIADRSPKYSTDAGNWTGTLLYHVQLGQSATQDEAIADLGERNMGDPATMVEFLNWSREHFPADRYALIMWDHGWTWRPGQSTIDETDADALDINELADALAVTGGADVVGFDECFMASLEIQAALRPYVSATVGSEDYVGWEGFKHDDVLEALNQNPQMDAHEMAAMLSSTMTDRTISAVSLDEGWDEMRAALDTWASALRAALPKERKAIDAAWKATQGFGDPLQKDLYDATIKIAANVKDPSVVAASQALQVAIDNIILHEWHRSPYYGAYGMTLYWPQRKKDMWVSYTPTIDDFQFYLTELDISKVSSWDEFIAAYAQ